MSDPYSPPSGSSGAEPLVVGARRAAPTPVPGPGARTGHSVGAVRWDARGSRLRASDTSFGIVGRTVITVVALLGMVAMAVFNIFGLAVYLVAMVWVLRDTWARPHRPPPPPPRPASHATRTGPGQSSNRAR